MFTSYIIEWKDYEELKATTLELQRRVENLEIKLEDAQETIDALKWEIRTLT